MKNILVGYVLDGKHSGIDKYLLGVCRVAHEEKVRLDFLTEEITPWIKEYLEDLGFGLYEVPSLKNPIGQYKAIKKIIKDNNYGGVYANISESFNCMLLLAAKTSGIPCRMVHSHSSGVDRASRLTRILRTALHKLFVPVVNRISTRRYACSDVAGKWMFGRKDYNIIYNAVDKSRFAFNLASRLNTRNELGLRDEHVLIHVGNFCYTKNQRFLMEIMQKITEKDEFDTNKRHILNFGHTIGHLIETKTDFQLTHGEAVAMGMIAEITNPKVEQILTLLLKKFNLLNHEIEKLDYLALINYDKKVSNGKISLLSIDSIGHSKLKQYRLEDLKNEQFWKEY